MQQSYGCARLFQYRLSFPEASVQSSTASEAEDYFAVFPRRSSDSETKEQGRRRSDSPESLRASQIVNVVGRLASHAGAVKRRIQKHAAHFAVRIAIGSGRFDKSVARLQAFMIRRGTNLGVTMSIAGHGRCGRRCGAATI